MTRTTDILIRPGVVDDAPILAQYNIDMALETEGIALDPQLIGPGVSAVLMDSRKGVYFVAEVGGRVVGQLMVTMEWSDWRNGMIWWIQSVYVHPDHRRRGVFRELFGHCQSQARLQGVVMLRLYVERENRTAQTTYARLGMSDSHYLVFGMGL